MVGLLINRDCMESLRRDIVDLQGMVVSVFSQAGAVRCPSWKFPDKASCDLDLVALLEHYGFAENNPEFTQRSHVVLLELVIDRLLLLLQSFTEYTENLTNEEVTPPSGAMGTCMSVGLVVSKYWDSLMKLGTLYQQLATEKKGHKEEVSSQMCSSQAENKHTEGSSSEHSESDVTIPGFQASSLTSSASSGMLCGNTSSRSEAKSAPCPDRPIQSISSQTVVESSLVPCDTCEKAQGSLWELGRTVIGICNSQNLPSSLSRFLKMAEETFRGKPLTAMDIGYWTSEQSKDLSRINKHLRALTELVSPLKDELETSQREKEELRKQLESFKDRLQKEKEAQEQLRKEAEVVFEKKHRENLQLVARLEKEKEDLQNKAVSLEKNISTLKEKLQSQEAAVQELEQAKADLLEEVRMKMVDKIRVQTRKERLEALTSQLEAAKQQVGWAMTELDKEKAKVESMCRHKESLQAKQRALTQQLDLLDQECEQVKASLADGEEERFLMKERLKELQEEKWEAQCQLEAQQKLTEKAEQEKLSVEQSASELQRTISELGELIQEMKEREKLLVFFPDLHIPVEAQFESTGDVMEDMGKQLQANIIRISILEKENVRLHAVVAKMKEAAQQEGPKLAKQRLEKEEDWRQVFKGLHGLIGATEREGPLRKEAPELIPPTQLWRQSDADDLYEDGRMRSPAGHLVTAGIQGAARRHPSHHTTAQSRTRSSQHTGSSSTASQRTPGHDLSKPPSGGAARKPPFTFSYEDPSYTRGRGRSRGSAHCARNPQK